MARRVLPSVLFAALILFGAAIVAPSPSLAQDTTASSAAMQMSGHPAHIHADTRDTLGGIDWSKVVVPERDDGERVTRRRPIEAAGDQRSRERGEDPELHHYIACDDLPGSAQGGKVRIALKERNDSGFEGAAMLMDNRDGATTIDAVLCTRGTMGTPEATPSS
jgi:hypothetical protein